VHEIKKYNHALRRTNILTSDDVSTYSNISFLSVRLLTWKPVACLKSAIFSKITVALQLPFSLVCPRPHSCSTRADSYHAKRGSSKYFMTIDCIRTNIWEAHIPFYYHPLRIKFCKWLWHQHTADELFLHNNVLTSETYFTREGLFNVHNDNLWARDNPHATMITSGHGIILMLQW
jgi:hypothetical protein